jgi:site-specific DNA-cytosine methylase
MKALMAPDEQPLAVNTICSNLDGWHLAMRPLLEKMEQCFTDELPGTFKFDTMIKQYFGNEIKRGRAKFIENDPRWRKPFSVYSNLKDIMKEFADDWITGGETHVADTDLLLGSTTCTEVSGECVNRKQHKDAVEYYLKKAMDDIMNERMPLQDLTEAEFETTGATTALALAMIVIKGIPMAIIENLWTVMQPNSAHGKACRWFMHIFGWLVITLNLNLKDHGVPHKRRRGFTILYWHRGADDIEEAEIQMTKRMQAKIDDCAVGCPELGAFVDEVEGQYPHIEKKQFKFPPGTGKKKDGSPADWTSKIVTKYALEEWNENDVQYVDPEDEVDETTRALDPDYYTLGKYLRAKVNYMQDRYFSGTESDHPLQGGEQTTDISHSIEYLEPPSLLAPSMKQTTKYFLFGRRRVPQSPVYFALQGYNKDDFPQIETLMIKETPLIEMMGDTTALPCNQATYWVTFSSLPLLRRVDCRDDMYCKLTQLLGYGFKKLPKTMNLKMEHAVDSKEEPDSLGEFSRWKKSMQDSVYQLPENACHGSSADAASASKPEESANDDVRSVESENGSHYGLESEVRGTSMEANMGSETEVSEVSFSHGLGMRGGL